jgi:hypothetical protein
MRRSTGKGSEMYRPHEAIRPSSELRLFAFRGRPTTSVWGNRSTDGTPSFRISSPPSTPIASPKVNLHSSHTSPCLLLFARSLSPERPSSRPRLPVRAAPFACASAPRPRIRCVVLFGCLSTPCALGVRRWGRVGATGPRIRRKGKFDEQTALSRPFAPVSGPRGVVAKGWGLCLVSWARLAG